MVTSICDAAVVDCEVGSKQYLTGNVVIFQVRTVTCVIHYNILIFIHSFIYINIHSFIPVLRWVGGTPLWLRDDHVPGGIRTKSHWTKPHRTISKRTKAKEDKNPGGQNPMGTKAQGDNIQVRQNPRRTKTQGHKIQCGQKPMEDNIQADNIPGGQNPKICVFVLGACVYCIGASRA